jgi:ferredoxin-nitrite reductase
MKIKIKLLRPFQDVVGKEDITMDIQGKTLQNLLDDLISQYPKLKDKMMDKKGNLDSFVNIFVNDKPTYTDQESKIKLNEGDRILIFPAIAGG